MSDAAGQTAHAYESLLARCESIVLTLSQTGTNARNVPVRTISLTAAAPKVVVGRSSKTASKGLVAAVDNCYFDCPVVSRFHAEIEADLKKGLLRLTDTGSLHGTLLNGSPLKKGVATDLRTGDTVSFGIHVARGVDLFYPISCTVDVMRHAYTPPVTKARSYSAPESADELSDASDGDNDCSSIDLEPISTDEEEDNDAVSSQASDAGDVTVPFDHMESSDYGEDESDHEDDDYESSPENGSDSDSDSASNSDSDFDANSNGCLEEELHGLQDDDADRAALEMSLEAAQGGDEGGVRDGARSEVSDSENDESGAFLYKELKQYNKGDAAASQSAGDSVPNHGLWTPLAGSPGNQAPGAAAADANGDGGDGGMEGPKMAAEEDSGNKFGRQSDSLADVSAPLSATNKCNISSILNPSPPPSSPVNERAALAGGLAPDSQEQCTFQPPPRATTATAASAAAQALHVPGFTYSADHDLPNGDRAMLKRLVAVMSGAEELVEAEKRHATKDNSFGNQAVTVLHYEKETMSKKRKAEEMLAATAAATAGPSASVPVAAAPVPTPSAPVDDSNPPAKRQASSAAVAARKQLRSRVWAVAETLGIAALGGAVVLGSLIYTAPAF